MTTPLTDFAPVPVITWEQVRPFGFLFVTLLLCSYLLYQWLLPKPIPGIPYNVESSRKIMGDIPALLREISGTDKTFIDYIMRQARSHNSPVVQLFLSPFRKPMVVINDFQESQDLLMRRKEFDRSQFLSDIFGGAVPEHHIMKPTNGVWKAHRRLLQDLMSPPFLNQVAGPNLYANTQSLIDLWTLKADIAQGRPFSATDDIYGAALDAIFAFTFGKSFSYNATAPNMHLLQGLSAEEIARLRGSGGDDDKPVGFPTAPRDKAVTATFDVAHAIEEINGIPFAKLVWKLVTARKARFSRALKLKDEYINDELKAAVARIQSSDADVRSAVDLMVQREAKIAQKDGRPTDYFSRTMLDETFGFVVAGHETTSTTILWGMKILASNPGSQTKLRETLRAAHSKAFEEKRSPKIEEITGTDIPYLDAVMEEILRVGGTVPAVDRQAVCDTEVLGFPIKKGTVVLCSGRGASMLEPGFEIDESKRSETSRLAKSDNRIRAWDDHEIGAFKPERWLVPVESEAAGGETTATKSQFDSTAGPQLAFGLGLRSCFGKRLAYLELRILLTMIIWNFELLPTPEELAGVAAIAGITYKPRQCFVRLRKAM
ncbi:hypothetical protein KJ359_008213 [Pestalotiopsis sp. 9143b]|nr:hypothetical protein KJ359_008213 [Pestalotiopsis sp. 9143b]